MINIADELNAATEQGVLGKTSQIKDTLQNKMQSEINTDVYNSLGLKASAQSVSEEAQARQAADSELRTLIYAAL